MYIHIHMYIIMCIVCRSLPVPVANDPRSEQPSETAVPFDLQDLGELGSTNGWVCYVLNSHDMS